MPCHVVASKGGGYDIVDPNGAKIGHSDTLPKAQASCRIRNEKGGYKDYSTKTGKPHTQQEKEEQRAKSKKSG